MKRPLCLLGFLSLAACSSDGSAVNPAPLDGGKDASLDATTDGAAEAATDGTGRDSGAPGDSGLDARDAANDAPSNPPSDAEGDGPRAIVNPCQLPGSLQFTASGTVVVPGGNSAWPDLTWLHLPTGFCVHYFGNVGNARQVRFAPGGELFVASPTRATTGGASWAGKNAIFVLPDDDLDGVADANLVFMTGMNGTQGMLFANGHFYYQSLPEGVSYGPDGGSPSFPTAIRRLPYKNGDRSPSGPSEQVADITVYEDWLHWPKTLDVADDGTIYVGNGGSQSEKCDPAHPFHGGILQIDPAPGAHPNGVEVAKGLRNPINVRCARGHDMCFALELALDYSANGGGREKIIPIRQGDDWGFPCCATQNLPYPAWADAGIDAGCSGVAAESNGFLIGDTPFGIDFEPGAWPAPWGGQAYVVTHGDAGNWAGARMVAVPMDASTGMLEPSTDVNGNDVGMVDSRPAGTTEPTPATRLTAARPRSPSPPMAASSWPTTTTATSYGSLRCSVRHRSLTVAVLRPAAIAAGLSPLGRPVWSSSQLTPSHRPLRAAS